MNELKFLALPITTLVFMVVFFSSTDLTVSFLSGIPLAIGLLGGIYMIRQNPSMDPRVKRQSWLALFVIVAIAMRLYALAQVA